MVYQCLEQGLQLLRKQGWGMMKDSGCPRAMRGIAARVQPP